MRGDYKREMKLTRSLSQLKLVSLLCAGALAATATAHAQTYQVTIQTSALNAAALSGDAPFGVEFQLNSGGSTASNNVTISNFNLGGGTASAPAYYTNTQSGAGTAAGNLSSQVTMSDSSATPFNLFSQNFTPGSTLSFDVTLSDRCGGNDADGFVIAIDELNTNGTGFEIPTTQGGGNDGVALAEFDLRATGIQVSTFAGADDSGPGRRWIGHGRRRFQRRDHQCGGDARTLRVGARPRRVPRICRPAPRDAQGLEKKCHAQTQRSQSTEGRVSRGERQRRLQRAEELF